MSFNDLLPDALMVRIIDSSGSKLFVPAQALFGLISDAGVLFTSEYKNGKYVDKHEPDISAHAPPMTITTVGLLRARMVADKLSQ